MINSKISLVYASINEQENKKEYISIENETGILLITEDLFVISFNNKEEMPYYKHIRTIANIESSYDTINFNPITVITK